MATYVERRIRRVSDDALPVSANPWRLTEALRWDTFLLGDVDAVVLVAPSGSGKTTEFINLACRLRLGGQCAVRCEAVALSTTEVLSNALEQLEAEAFGIWRETEQSLVLLIDAVDELQLRGADFRRMLRVIARSADLASRSVKLVFSARNGAWPTERTGQVASLFHPFRSRDPAVELVTFAALDTGQVGALAEAYGATRCREFVRHLEEDDVDSLMDLRPMDVELLVRQWNSTGRLGRWVDVLAGFLESAGAEAGPDRARPPSLSPQQVRRALLRIGAATTLMKTPHVSLPESPPVQSLVSSRRLFDDWGLSALLELFEGGMFSPRGSDAVQLPQGAVTHYLTARWLVERVHAGMPLAALSDLLFVQIPGARNRSLPQSRRPIAGWVATLLPEFRATLSRHSPRDFLYEGDPECLTIEDIRPALGKLMDSIASEERFEWPTQATRRKLARRELANDVLLMLRRHAQSPSALLQLLEFAIAGCHGEAVPLALTWALGDSQHPQVRAESIRLVRALGSAAQVAELVAITDAADEDIRRELLQALAPAHLSGATLLTFLRGGRPGAFDLGVAFLSLAKSLSVAQIDELLELVLPIIDTETISSEVTRAADIAWILVAARLGSPGESPVLIGALLAIERLQIHGVSLSPAVEEAEVERAIGGNRERRRSLWEARVAREAGRSDWLHISSPQFGDLEREDFDWAVAAAGATVGIPAIQERRSFVLNRLLAMLQDAELEAIRTTAQGSLAERLDQVLEGRATTRRYRDGRENERLAEHEENRAALLPHREGIRAGTDLHALAWAYGRLRGDGTHRRLDLQGLREEIGEDLARDVRAGFIAAWRRQTVELPIPGDNSVPFAVLVGLAGVSLDFQDGLDAGSMSAGEVVLATRLAIRELNDFPSWAEDLLAAHREVFRRELAAVLALEWNAMADHHGVLARASYCSAPIAAEMRAIVMELMAEGPPASVRAARYGVDALLTSTAAGEHVAGLVTRALNQAGQADPASVEWLRALAHFDPRECMERLAALPAELIVTVAARVYDDVNERRRAVRKTALLAPENIEAWARLLLDVVPPEADVRHASVFTPNDRDHAQDFRMLCIAQLSRDPTPAAGAALGRLARAPQNRNQARRSWLRRLRSEQEAVAAEALATPWSETQVLAVERGDERAPSTLPELHALVLRHLDHVRRLVENDDFSYRRLFGKKTKEREIQYWVASCLRERSRRLYSVVRENVVDNDKEVDITAIADGVGQVPIEIKPLGRYSAVALEGTLEDQLLGRYMQPSARGFGVLLVVRRNQRSWTIGKRRVDLDGLCRHLQQRADALGAQHGKVLTVAAIDLLQ